MEIPEGYMLISKVELNNLKRVEKKLNALYAGGVDNWEWYSDSLENAGLFDDENE